MNETAAAEVLSGSALELNLRVLRPILSDPNVTELPANVLDAIGSLNAGQVSPAVQTSTGWLSILVVHRDTVPKPTFDQLRPEITDFLVNQERSRLFQEWFSKQFSGAPVTVGRYYGKWNPQLHTVV